LVSLRAATVRQAAQTLSYAFLIVVFAIIFGSRFLPMPWLAAIARAVASESLLQIQILAALFLVVVDAALYAAARVRFQRARLILD
jgi:ABC-2 type transport system permease protein